MGTKDWKKEKGIYEWTNKKSGDVLDVMGIEGEYEIFLQSDKKGDETLRVTKSESQALSFAKSYMRTH